MFSFLLGICLSVELLGDMVTLCLTNPLKNCQAVFQSICIPTNSVWGFQFLHIVVNTCYYLSYRHPSGCKGIPHCGFDLHFPDGLGCSVYIHVLQAICRSPLRNVYSCSLPIFQTGLFVLHYWVTGVLCIFWIQVLYRIY